MIPNALRHLTVRLSSRLFLILNDGPYSRMSRFMGVPFAILGRSIGCYTCGIGSSCSESWPE